MTDLALSVSLSQRALLVSSSLDHLSKGILTRDDPDERVGCGVERLVGRELN